MVKEGRFRSDLYMRLNPACTVDLPPLADRQVELGRLVEFCVERALDGPYLRELVDQYVERYDLGKVALRASTGTVPKASDGVLWLLIPKKSMVLLRRHRWPGNLREFQMTVENALVFTFAELVQVRGGQRPDVVQLRPKQLRDLLRHAGAELPDTPTDGWSMEVSVRADETLNKVSADVERQYFTALFMVHGGDFREMARILMNDPDCARKVQLRFNQLGLKVRELRKRL